MPCMILQLLQVTPTGGPPWRLLALHWMEDMQNDVMIDIPVADFRDIERPPLTTNKKPSCR